MKALAPLLVIFLIIPGLVNAQEYDDLYFTSSDREEARKAYQSQVANNIDYTTKTVDEYKLTTPEINSNRIFSTSQGRTVNPEYVAQYRSRAEARAQSEDAGEEVYFDENYQADQYQQQADNNTNPTIINNNYYGAGNWNDPYFNQGWADPFYDPFYVNDWRWRYNDWRWRRNSWYHDPFWAVAPGWSVSIGFNYGWGAARWGGWYGNRWSRWSYDPWYSPYYAGGFAYNNFYDPFWHPGVWSRPVYYSNVTYVNNHNEPNNYIRRGRPSVERGTIINRSESLNGERSSVSRVPVRRSALNGERNTGDGTASGRVIDRTGIESRSPRDYSDVQGRYMDRSYNRNGINSRSVDSYNRSRNTNERYVPSRTNTNRNYSPTRSGSSNERTVTPSRSSGNNRSYTPSRSSGNNNRSYTPSRSSGNNNRSYTPSRSSGNNNRSYTPSRSSGNNNRSYTPSRSSGSSSGSSYTPSRSSSSSSGTSGRSSSGSSSSSRGRGGN